MEEIYQILRRHPDAANLMRGTKMKAEVLSAGGSRAIISGIKLKHVEKMGAQEIEKLVARALEDHYPPEIFHVDLVVGNKLHVSFSAGQAAAVVRNLGWELRRARSGRLE